MLGEFGLELIRECVRSHSLIQPYNEDKVRCVLQEIHSLYQQNEKAVWMDPPPRAAIVLRHAALERNKRCLLAYIHHRAELIRNMRWQFGAVLPPDIKANLCEAEQAFSSKYNTLLATYMRSVGSGAGIDLMSDLEPPKSLYVQVRCKQDYGEMITENGSVILLKKNTQHYLPRSQCEHLIRQGVLEHVST